MSEIYLEGTLSNQIVKTSATTSNVYYIYQFQTSCNEGFINIVNVFSKKDLNIKNGDFVKLSVSISLQNNEIFYTSKGLINA